MLVDSYGRDLKWLESRAPKGKPSPFMLWLSDIWPMPSVELWKAAGTLRKKAGEQI